MKEKNHTDKDKYIIKLVARYKLITYIIMEEVMKKIKINGYFCHPWVTLLKCLSYKVIKSEQYKQF